MAVKHIVLLKFNPDASSSERAHCAESFAKLATEIDGITGFEQGPNSSTEDRAKGFNHAATITFKDNAALDAYLPHPAHKAFVALLRTLTQDVLVFDYLTA